MNTTAGRIRSITEVARQDGKAYSFKSSSRSSLEIQMVSTPTVKSKEKGPSFANIGDTVDITEDPQPSSNRLNYNLSNCIYGDYSKTSQELMSPELVKRRVNETTKRTQHQPHVKSPPVLVKQLSDQDNGKKVKPIGERPGSKLTLKPIRTNHHQEESTLKNHQKNSLAAKSVLSSPSKPMRANSDDLDKFKKTFAATFTTAVKKCIPEKKGLPPKPSDKIVKKTGTPVTGTRSIQKDTGKINDLYKMINFIEADSSLQKSKQEFRDMIKRLNTNAKDESNGFNEDTVVPHLKLKGVLGNMKSI